MAASSSPVDHDWNALFEQLGWCVNASRPKAEVDLDCAKAVDRVIASWQQHMDHTKSSQVLDGEVADPTSDDWSVDSMTLRRLHLMSLQSRSRQRRGTVSKLQPKAASDEVCMAVAPQQPTSSPVSKGGAEAQEDADLSLFLTEVLGDKNERVAPLATSLQTVRQRVGSAGQIDSNVVGDNSFGSSHLLDPSWVQPASTNKRGGGKKKGPMRFENAEKQQSREQRIPVASAVSGSFASAKRLSGRPIDTAGHDMLYPSYTKHPVLQRPPCWTPGGDDLFADSHSEIPAHHFSAAPHASRLPFQSTASYNFETYPGSRQMYFFDQQLQMPMAMHDHSGGYPNDFMVPAALHNQHPSLARTQAWTPWAGSV
jgi:hypothetical protein